MVFKFIDESSTTAFELGWEKTANTYFATEEWGDFIKERFEKLEESETLQGKIVQEDYPWICDDHLYIISRRINSAPYFFNALYATYSNEIFLLIWMSFCQTLQGLNKLTVHDWKNLDQQKIDVNFNFSPHDTEKQYEIKLGPRQSSSIKKIKKYPSVYEIILDIDNDTASKRYNKSKQHPEHTNDNGRKLLEKKEWNIRIFITLEKKIKFPEFITKYSPEKNYTYQKKIHLIFDKNGLNRDEYTHLTENICRFLHVNKMNEEKNIY